MVADPDEGLFSILKLCRMFRIFRIAKVSSPGLLNRHFQFKPFPLPVYFRLPIMINMTAKSPDRHNENLRIMIRSILASTGELCFMLTLLRTRDLRTTNIICSTPLVRFFPYTQISHFQSFNNYFQFRFVSDWFSRLHMPLTYIIQAI